MNVPIRKLKAQLSRYIREASAGKDVVVTSRGSAVVRIVPVVTEQPTKPLSREELRAKLGVDTGYPNRKRKIQASPTDHKNSTRRTHDGRNSERRASVIVYFDTSALVKLYVDEPRAKPARAAAEAAAVIATSMLTYAEMRSAFARKRRFGEITPDQLERFKKEFETDWNTFDIVVIGETIVRRAGDFAENYLLKGFDAVHLATAEVSVRDSARSPSPASMPSCRAPRRHAG